MFNCRACSNSPFGEFFGCGNQDPRRSIATSESTSQFSEAETEQEMFIPRDEQGIKEARERWIKYVHPRVAPIWTRAQIQDMLATIASNVDREEDPITGGPDEDECIIWEGKVSAGDAAVMDVSKPGDSGPSETYVTRTYVFMYADQASLNRMKSGKFGMACGTPDCVRLCHAEGYNELWGLKYNAQGDASGPNHMGIIPDGPLPPRLQLGNGPKKGVPPKGPPTKMAGKGPKAKPKR